LTDRFAAEASAAAGRAPALHSLELGWNDWSGTGLASWLAAVDVVRLQRLSLAAPLSDRAADLLAQRLRTSSSSVVLTLNCVSVQRSI